MADDAAGRAFAFALVVLGLAGCVAPAEEPRADAGWTPVCNGPHIANETPLCTMSLGDVEHNNVETTLATHPTDRDTVLVAWIDRATATIWSAITHDAGVTWSTHPMQDPAKQPQAPGLDGWWGTDPVAGFAPNGDPIVLFMHLHSASADDEVGPAYVYSYGWLNDELAFARSTDGGSTWSYSAISAPADGWLFGPDYPTFAVAPDTGDIHVVAQVFTEAPVGVGVVAGGSGAASALPVAGGSFVWKSTDGGSTWSDAMPVRGPAQPAGRQLDGAPRIAAGPNGLVVVTAVEITWLAGSIQSRDRGMAWVSTDGGDTFSAHDLGMVQPLGPAVVDGRSIHLLAAEASPDPLERLGGDLLLFDSNDRGATWDETTIGTFPSSIRWAMLANVTGGWAALVRYGPTENGSYGVRLVVPGTQIELAPLDFRSGWGDYGGLGTAADGSLWAAWAKPRGVEHSQVAVLHLARA